MRNRYIGSNIKTRSANPLQRAYHYYALVILISLACVADANAQNKQTTVTSQYYRTADIDDAGTDRRLVLHELLFTTRQTAHSFFRAYH